MDSAARSSLWMRSAFVALQWVIAAVVLYVAVSVTGVADSLRGLMLSFAGPQAVEGHIQAETMQTITFEKTLQDGTKVTATYVQKPEEPYATFITRALAEWEALCKALGE